MTVLDSSAVMASLLGEPSAEAVEQAIERSIDLVMASPTLVELSIVGEGRLGLRGREGVRRFVERSGVEVLAFDRDLADAAAEGWRRFGKGNHPAGLNLGDCFTYALAKRRGDAVLCVGDDFARTDVPVVPLG